MDKGVEVLRPPAVMLLVYHGSTRGSVHAATTDFIELRICSDFDDEDTPVGYYDIFVK